MGMRESPGRGLPRARRVVVAVLMVLISALALCACGSSSSSPSPSAASEASLLEPSDFEKYPEDSVERALLEYWSNLQFRSWADVATYYDARFRDFVGTTNIVEAKKLLASEYPLLDPKIVRVSTSKGNTTIFYTLKLPEGTKQLNSMTWRKDGGEWQIIYDSRLDAELGQLFQNRGEVEATGEPVDGSKAPSAEALEAGEKGAELQGRFLQQELSSTAP